MEIIDVFEYFLAHDLGIKTRLSEYDVPESDLQLLVGDVVKTAFTEEGTMRAWKPLVAEEVMEILKLAY